MRLTIIPNDNTVMVDGVGARVDLSHLPANVHAIQWDGEAGEVEYIKPANRRITSLDDIAEPAEPEGNVALSREVIDAIVAKHTEAMEAAKAERHTLTVDQLPPQGHAE